MNQSAIILTGAIAVAGFITFSGAASGFTNEKGARASGIKVFPRYRDWKLISVAHEEGNLNDIRAILGNDLAVKAYREGKLPFPDGTVVARIAWGYIPSKENDEAFGHTQSFVPGPATDSYLQFMVKDSRKYATTGGWGFAQFSKDGKPADETAHKTCLPCHERSKAHDLVFTRYAP